jgi:hypothetical protein
MRRSVQQLPQHGRIQRSERPFGRVIENLVLRGFVIQGGDDRKLRSRCGYLTSFVVLFGRASGAVGSMLRRSG